MKKDIRYQYNASDTYEEYNCMSYYEEDHSYSESVLFFKVALMFRMGE